MLAERKVEVKQFRCFRCNALLAEIDPLDSTVVIKCWRCNSFNAYHPRKGTGLMAGSRVLTFGTAFA